MTIELENSFRKDFEKSLVEALRNHEEYLSHKNDNFREFYSLIMANKRIWPFMFAESLRFSRFDEDVNDLLTLQSWAVNCFLDDSYPKVRHFKREYEEEMFSFSDEEEATPLRFPTGEFLECEFNDPDYCESRFFIGNDDDRSSLEECISAVHKTISKLGKEGCK